MRRVSPLALVAIFTACAPGPGDACDNGVPEGSLSCLTAADTCAEGSFCDRGTCQARPTSCTMDGPAVCGCDGEIYVNECWARLSGVTPLPANVDPATGEPSCGGCLGETCPLDGVCLRDGIGAGFSCCPPGAIC